MREMVLNFPSLSMPAYDCESVAHWRPDLWL